MGGSTPHRLRLRTYRAGVPIQAGGGAINDADRANAPFWVILVSVVLVIAVAAASSAGPCDNVKSQVRQAIQARESAAEIADLQLNSHNCTLAFAHSRP